MSIFKKLFAQSDSSPEETLVESLRRLSEAIRGQNSNWADVLTKFHDEITTEFSSGAPINRRYQLARKVEQLFGGMGSLNDIALPEDCERLRGELYTAVQCVLRDYWRALGRGSHPDGGQKFVIGAVVRLIPGAVRYINRDESAVVVPNTPEAAKQLWKIVRYDGPDITNMPSYLVQHDNTFMSARQESLKLFSEP